jgi:uroporphyrinogen-III synthase
VIAKPLSGKAVVNTRAVHQSAELDALLVERGARPISYPCIAIAPPENTAPLDEGLRALASGGFDWLLLTSDNAVQSISRRAADLGIRREAFRKAKVAAIGPKTAEAAREALGIEAALVPEEYVAEALASTLDASPGTRMFLPQSDLARDALENALRASGVALVTAQAYRNIPGSGGDDVPALLAARQIDAVIFTSPSTVRNFLARIEAEGGSRDNLSGVCLASIGPVTSAALDKAGLAADVSPETYTLSGVLDALERRFETSLSENA